MTFEWQQIWYGAVVTVINAWHEQGKNRTGETRHDFREWCQVMDWIVQNIFKAAPLMDDHDEAKGRAANPNLTFLRSLAIAVNEDHQLAQPLSATGLVNLCAEKEIEIPGLSNDKQADVEAGRKQVGIILARLFGEKTELAVEGFKVVRTEESATTDHGNAQTLKKYTFSLISKADTADINPPPQPDIPVPAVTPVADVEIGSGIPPNPTIGLVPPVLLPIPPANVPRKPVKATKASGLKTI